MRYLDVCSSSPRRKVLCSQLIEDPSEDGLSVSSFPGSPQRMALMLVCGYFQRPRRVFQRVSAVNLRALGGLSQYSGTSI